MVFYFYFLSRMPYFVQNTQRPMLNRNNVKEAKNEPNESNEPT